MAVKHLHHIVPTDPIGDRTDRQVASGDLAPIVGITRRVPRPPKREGDGWEPARTVENLATDRDVADG